MSAVKVQRWARWLSARYPDDPGVLAIRGELLQRPVAASPTAQFAVAVECVEDRFFFAILAALCQDLRSLTRATTELVIVRSINGAMGRGWRQSLTRSAVLAWLLSNRWVRALQGIADRVAYRSTSLSHPLGDLVDRLRSDRLWRSEQGNQDISALQIDGICVGDLIIDSYLRFRPSPRFDLADPFARDLIYQAHRDIRRSRAYFRRRKPHLYLTAYTTYIEHGIAVRVALQENIPVRCFGNFTEFGKTLHPADSYHTADTSAYRARFDALDRQPERLAEAEAALRTRLSGGIDAATSYMRVSAYAAGATEVPDVAGAVIVFLHDFYDSPHVYHDMVFPDFWTWTCFTIDALRESGRKFLIKPHPNQISLSSEALQQLVARYPGLPLLPSGVTNVQLVEAGMLCGVTVYGTVAHELAYLGVPTIGCARHPHHSFDFCRTAHSIDEYRRLLAAPEILPVLREEMRRQALAFYYMHNLHALPEQLDLRIKLLSFWKACVSEETPPELLAQRLREVRESVAFRAATNRMLAESLPAS